MERLVRKYLRKHKPKLVVVTGSVGKTGAKIAIATVLGEAYRVRTHEGNHNTHLSAPLAILGVEYPDDIRSFSAWWNVWRAARERIREPKDVDVIIQELGTDQPGDVGHFGKYLHPDVAVVTAVSDEHMEFFKSLDVVAQEELAVASFSEMTIVNRDDIESRFAQYAQTDNIYTYGLGEHAEYQIVLEPNSPLEGRIGQLITPEWEQIPITLQLIGDQSIKSAVAAAAVGAKLGLTSQQVAVGLSKLRPVSGRMQVLRGLKESILIDDTYNSSPLAARAALQTLYDIEAPQRIAVLGTMRELGELSPKAHEQLGDFCDPQKLAWVVTIGEEAKKYLAPAASKKGNQVRSFDNPYDAGSFVHSVLEPNAAVLLKGSQNTIFAEEAIKILLHNTDDEQLLVRQSPYWLKIKAEQFQRPVGED